MLYRPNCKFLTKELIRVTENVDNISAFNSFIVTPVILSFFSIKINRIHKFMQYSAANSLNILDVLYGHVVSLSRLIVHATMNLLHFHSIFYVLQTTSCTVQHLSWACHNKWIMQMRTWNSLWRNWNKMFLKHSNEAIYAVRQGPQNSSSSP